MTDDIVTRLRTPSSTEKNGIVFFFPPNKTQLEAANEIERLRNALAEQTIIHEVQKTNTLNEIEELRKELSKWATTPPNRMVCVTHGEMFMCFDEYMDGVYWCEGCRND
jgi:hypothetical protein